MATLAEVRRRIASLQNTQQITRALQAVAASKLRRVQARAEAARPYADRMAEVLTEVASRSTGTRNPFLTRRDVKKRLMILVSADRGLAGGLNVNAFRAALGYIRQGPDTVLVTIGRKGRDYFRRLGVSIIADVSQTGDRPELKDILPAITVARDEYLNGNIDQIALLHTHFVSVAKQEPRVSILVPVEVPERKEGVRVDYLYEPEPEEVLASLLPRYVEAQVYAAVLDNLASFYAAQMIAMRNATDNAGELITDLTLLRNKVRQATITKELSEIVGGAEALAAG
ncbi:MAG: ATP synthase F1 subunit gamma [Chloroflexi bacterium]|nr:MAG: ATP synthase F1 subunit gamma [Chloroflexota bacterium]